MIRYALEAGLVGLFLGFYAMATVTRRCLRDLRHLSRQLAAAVHEARAAGGRDAGV